MIWFAKISVLWVFYRKAAIFLLPCLIKYITGFDCPGCGFQRSVIALSHGDIVTSFLLYPATIPFLVSFCCGIAVKLTNGNGEAIWLKSLYFLTGGIMVAAYGWKLMQHFS